jgi:hypothetical protein
MPNHKRSKNVHVENIRSVVQYVNDVANIV